MRVALFDYELPEERIAQHPTPDREAARLLVLAEIVSHGTITELPELLPPRSLVVVNDTRVRRARLIAKKTSGGRAEIFLLRPLAAGRWLAMGRSSKPFRFPTVLEVLGRAGETTPLRVRLVSRLEDGLLDVELETSEGSVDDAIERFGRIPLPPYIKRDADDADAERYQTIFARTLGAVAAPTAGLHLSRALLDRLEARGHTMTTVTLHVGLGTFQPVAVDDFDDHPMHAESFEVSAQAARAIAAARAEKRPIVAIGTTVVRALESATNAGGAVGAFAGETRLLIQPGHFFRVVSHLVTNFHLPRSTLLALVCAFGGRERVLEAYANAVRERYRFFSYGDAMLIHRASPE